MSLFLRPMLARGPRWWAVVLLLIAASPFAGVRTGATGTVFTATTVAALIADLNTANTQPSQGPYAINLAAGGVYTLIAEAATGSGTGLPIIVSGVDVTINGNGAAIQRSAAGGTTDFRLFMVNGGATLRLNALALRNGSAVGAAGANGAPGSAGTPGGGAGGGAIFVSSNGTLTVSGGTFAGNRAGGGPGGNGGNGHDNSGTPGGAGGAGGDAGNAGGGAIDNFGTLVVAASTFSGNTAVGGNGGNGGNGGSGMGSPGGKGGNAGNAGIATGGAIVNSGTATVTNSTFAANGATGGRGGDGGNPGTGSGSGTVGFFGPGGAGQGGAMGDTISGTLTVTNSTITANSAVGGSGGSGFGGSGGTGSGSGGGLRTPGGNVTVKNTILASNTALDDGNCGNFVTDGGNNLEFNPAMTCNFSNSAQTGDPALGALANHGGPTPTIALGTGSAAMGHGDHATCAGVSVGGVDQRGLPRPTPCSIGAFEPQPAPFPTLDALSPSSGSITGGSSATLKGVGFASGATVLFGTVPAMSPVVVGGTMITAMAPGHAAGAVDVTVINPDGQAATLTLAYTFGIVAPLPSPRPTAPPSVSTPKPLPDAPRATGTPSLVGTPNPLPPHR